MVQTGALALIAVIPPVCEETSAFAGQRGRPTAIASIGGHAGPILDDLPSLRGFRLLAQVCVCISTTTERSPAVIFGSLPISLKAAFTKLRMNTDHLAPSSWVRTMTSLPGDSISLYRAKSLYSEPGDGLQQALQSYRAASAEGDCPDGLRS